MFDELKPLEKHLNEFVYNSRKPFFNDDSDYTTNAPSYYDDLARKNKLIKHLAIRIWDYDKEMVKRLKEWDKNLEEFPDEILKLLEKWMHDGTFEVIMDEVLENRYERLEYHVNDIAVHVKDFGAVGDGVTDDSIAIQNAFDSVKDGGTVMFGNGDYVINTPIHLHAADPIIRNNISANDNNHPKNNLIIKGGGGNLYAGPYLEDLPIFYVHSRYKDGTDTEIYDLSLYGFGNGSNKKGSGIAWYTENLDDKEMVEGYAKHFKMYNVKIRNFKYGFKPMGTTIRLFGCLFQGNGIGVWGTWVPNDISFFGCDFRRNEKGVFIESSFAGYTPVKQNFIGCIVESNSIYGVEIWRGLSASFTDTYFENNGYNDNSIGSSIKITGGNGIGGNHTLSGCYFQSSNVYDIYLEYSPQGPLITSGCKKSAKIFIGNNAGVRPYRQHVLKDWLLEDIVTGSNPPDGTIVHLGDGMYQMDGGKLVILSPSVPRFRDDGSTSYIPQENGQSGVHNFSYSEYPYIEGNKTLKTIDFEGATGSEIEVTIFAEGLNISGAVSHMGMIKSDFIIFKDGQSGKRLYTSGPFNKRVINSPSKVNATSAIQLGGLFDDSDITVTPLVGGLAIGLTDMINPSVEAMGKAQRVVYSVYITYKSNNSIGSGISNDRPYIK